MEGTRVKLQTGNKDEIQMRRNSSNRASPNLQNSPSIASNDDPDLQLFKWAHTNDVRRRSSDAAGHKWIIENMKDGNQSDDEDPLGLLQETNHEDEEDYDDSPISSRPESKSPQILFPPDSLWEEARRDSFFEKARRDSIRWVEENKKEILREMKNNQDGIDSIPDIPDGIDSVPDTPVLKRNSYMEKAPSVQVVVTSYDDEPSDDNPSDDEVAEPPRSWIASAIRRLSQSVITEPTDKDLSELQNRGQVALEVREIETKRRGSQSLTSDVVKIMAEWEKEHKERRASCIEQDNTDNQNVNNASLDLESHKGSHDNEVKVIITSPEDESEEIETPRNWISNTIRRLSNASSIDDSHTDDSRSSKENISYRKDSNISEDYTYSSESIDDSQRIFNNHGINEQNSVYEDDETPKGWLATTIRRLSSVGNLDDERKASEEDENISIQDDYEDTGIDIRRASTGSSRRGSHKDEENIQSLGKKSTEGSRRGSYKSDYPKGLKKERTHDSSPEDNGQGFNDSPAEEKPTEWLASAIRRLSTVPTEEGSTIPDESSVYESRESNNNETRRKSTGKKPSLSESRNSINTDEQPDEQNMLSPEDAPTGWLVNAVRRLSSASIDDNINEKRISIDRRSSNQSSHRNESSRGTSRTSFHADLQDANKESDDSSVMLMSEDSPSGWLAGAVRRFSSVPNDKDLIENRRLSNDEQRDLKNTLSVERRRSSQGSYKNESREASRSASRTSFHTDQQDENIELKKTSRSASKNLIHDEQESQSMLLPEDTPSGWLASAVRRLSSVSNDHNTNVEERRLSTENTASNSEMYVTQMTQRSRNASKSSIHDEQQNLENTLSADGTPTGWLVNAVRRLSSVAPEVSNIEEISTSVQEDHYLKSSRSSSKNSIYNEEDSKSILSPEDTPTGWLSGAIRRLSSVSNENNINNINMEERRLSTGSTHDNSEIYTSQKAHKSRNARRLSSSSFENDLGAEERKASTGNTQNLRRRSSQGSQRSRSASRNSLNYDEQKDSKNILSPEDTPSGWLANAVRRLSSAPIENDIGTEERKASTDNTQNIRRRSSQGSHRSRSASRSSLNYEQKDSKNILSPEDTPSGWLDNAVRRLSSGSIENDIRTEERKASTDDTQNIRRRSSQGSHRSRSASRSSLNFDEVNDSKNILSPEDTPSGWLATAVRRLSSVSGEDMKNKRSTNPPNIPPPPVPYASSEEEDEIEKSIISSTGRRLSSKLRKSETPPTEEELESKVESLSPSETQQLQSNPNWMNTAIRRLSMREEETIKIPHEIYKNNSEINQQNIVKPVTNLDSSGEDYTPVFISKKKIGKGMAWQNGFDWHSLQGPPDVTFCGCGFLGIYMVGVAEVLLEHRPNILQGRIGGSSVGSLIAACLVTGVPLQKLRQSLLHVADLAQAYTLGPLNPWFTLEEPLLQGLLEMLPQDAHIKASGRLFLSLTRLSNLSNEVVSEYPTRDELLRAILCCCWLPGISSFTAPTFMGTSYIDGAFSAVNPWHGLSSNLSISAYAGSFGICPDDSDLYPYQPQISALGVAYNMQPKNGTRAVDALMPPPGDILDKYYHNGVYDTHIFLTTLK